MGRNEGDVKQRRAKRREMTEEGEKEVTVRRKGDEEREVGVMEKKGQKKGREERLKKEEESRRCFSTTESSASPEMLLWEGVEEGVNLEL